MHADLPYRGLVFCLLACAVATTVAATVRAEELIVNGSFENTAGSYAPNGGGYMPLQIGSTTIPGWTVTHAQVAWIAAPNPFNLIPAQGSFFLDLTGDHDNASFAGVAQTIATLPSHGYQLRVSVGAHQGIGAYGGQKQIEVIVDGASTTFTLIPAGTGNQWVTFTLNFVATGAATQITVHGTSSGSGGQYVGLDNVSVVPMSVPCPADLNGSSIVDGADLGQLLAAWGSANPSADLNGSGLVDGADLGQLLAAWGPCP